MKKIFYILPLLAVCACTNKPATDRSLGLTASIIENCPEYMESLANGFAKAVMAGDLQKAMTYLSPNYIKEQHDGILEGRTDQFFRELLIGTITDQDGKEQFYVPASLDEIASIDDINTDCIKLEPSATFHIKLKDGRSYYRTLETEAVKTEEGYRPLFVGDLGFLFLF